MIVALDPGLNLGIAWIEEDGALSRAEVVALEDVHGAIFSDARTAVVGDGTGSAEVQTRLRALDVPFVVIDETDTTLEARALYFADHPPRGLSRLLPAGLRSPPRPIDDYAAYAIGLRYLKTSGRAL